VLANQSDGTKVPAKVHSLTTFGMDWSLLTCCCEVCTVLIKSHHGNLLWSVKDLQLSTA
jgi:hypothetical protein